MELTATQQLVHQMYIAYYQRPADPEGLQYWVDQLEQHGDWGVISAAFAASPENEALYGGMSREEVIAEIYQSAFGREAVQAEVDFWAASEHSLTNLAFAIVGGAQNDDLAVVNNKVAFAAELGTLVGTNTAYNGLAIDPKQTLVGIDKDTVVDTAYVNNVITASDSDGTATFTLTEIPTQTETTLLADDIPVELLLDFLADVAGLDLLELGLVDANGNLLQGIENININDNTATNSADADGSASININLTSGETIAALVDARLALVSDILFTDYLTTDTTTTQTGIVLTPSTNNGGTFEEGFTSAIDDHIVAGRTELLHGAYIDGGAGYNTLEVDMKGFFAQPFQLLNIQEVQVQNLQNVYTVSQTIIDGAETNFPISDIRNGDVSILDLSRAGDLEKLVVTEGFGLDGDAGLIVTGIQNYATARLEGQFDASVDLFYNRGQGNELTVELANVDFNDTFSVNQNVGNLTLVSEGAVNTLNSVDFGSNFLKLTVSGTGLLSIEDDLNFGFGEATIDASASTGGVRLSVDTQAGFSALEEITITGSQARDVFTINSAADAGVLLNIDTGAGRDTIKLNDALSAGQGSVITGENLTVEVNANADLRKADVSGVDRFVLDADGGLLLMQAQVEELGAAVFTAAHNDWPVLSIEITEAGTVLSDMIDLSALGENVKLAFNVKAGASLEMTAEELHTYLSEGAIVGDGVVTVTNAGLGFDVDDARVDTTQNDPNGAILGDGIGTIVAGDFGGTLHVERAANGFERPAPAADTDVLVIDTTGTGGVEVGANDISLTDNDDAFSTEASTVIVKGDDDITFNAPVEMLFDGPVPAGFTLDFSELTGALNNLTIEQFNNVAAVVGNGAEGVRINVALEGDVAVEGNATGLVSSGVEQYVVVDINDTSDDDNDQDATTVSFHVCDNTQDVEVLGLQGNGGSTLTFTNIPWGAVNPTILFEGDGFGNWDQLPKAAGNPNQSNVGTIVAEYFFPGAPANVLITNQGVAPGLTSTGEERPIVIDGIETTNAQSLNITVEDGNGVISSIIGDANLEDVTLTSANDVTLHLDGDDLDSIDATAVDGVATLHIENDTDFSDTELSGIDAVVLENVVIVTMTIDQITDIGAANITVENEGDAATLNIGNYDGQLFDFSALALDGITVASVTFAEGIDVTVDAGTDFTGVTQLIIPQNTTVVMSAEQFKQLVESGATIVTDPAATVGDEAGALTVDLNGDLTIGAADETTIAGANVTFATADGETLNVADFTLADGLQVTGDATAATKPLVNFTFDTDEDAAVRFDETIDVAAYQDVDLRILDSLLNNFWIDANANSVEDAGENSQSIEDLLDNLASANILNIYQEEAVVVVLDPRDREVVVEPNAIVNGIEFSAVGALADYVRSIDLTLQANATDSATINGGITVNDADVEAGFTILTINAEDVGGAAAPVVINGDILSDAAEAGAEGELTSVVINANTDITINGTLVFNSLVDGSTATLTLNGAGDITISALDATDVDIDTLNIVNNATGVVNVPGASPATTLAAGGAGDVSNIVISGTGDTLNFGTADDAATPLVNESNSGVNAIDLASINAAGYEGDLNLGIITGTVGESLTITGSQGITTLTLGDAADAGAPTTAFTMDATDDVTIDLSGSAAGSAVTITSDAVLPDMTAEAAATAGSLTISGALVIEGNVDFRTLVDVDGNNKLDLSGVTGIELAAGASVQLTDDQWADLTPAQQAAIAGAGVTLAVTDADAADFHDGTSVNLTDVRGTTAIQVQEDLTGNLVVTEAQATTITTGTFDADGVFTASQWDHDSTGTTADIARVAGDFRGFTNGFTNNVFVMVEGAAQDTSELLGVDSIRIIESGEADTALTVSEEQVAVLATGTDTVVTSAAAGDVIEELSNLTIAVSVDTGNTDIEGNPLIVDSSFSITNDGLGNADIINATGNAAAIGTAQLGASAIAVNDLLNEAATVTWNAVGTTATMKLAAGIATDLTAAVGYDTFIFAATLDTDTSSQLTIADFKASGTDVINFAALEDAAGTVIESVDSGDDNLFALTADAVYLLASGNNADAATVAGEISADADGTTELAVGETAYFFMTTGATTAIYQYTEEGVADVQDTELTLIGTIDAALVAADIVLA